MTEADVADLKRRLRVLFCHGRSLCQSACREDALSAAEFAAERRPAESALLAYGGRMTVESSVIRPLAGTDVFRYVAGFDGLVVAQMIAMEAIDILCRSVQA